MRGKFKVIVSDLHLGAGFQSQGNALEDFACDHEFATFLSELVAESRDRRAEVELILNGDVFEMHQVPHVDDFAPARAYRAEHYRSTSEPDATRKIGHVIHGHPAFFEAIRSFLRAGSPRRWVTIIKGNHDVELHWTGVQQRIREAVGAMGERADLLCFEERRISRDGIYVEHGCQYAEAMSRVPDMEEPHDPDAPDQLLLPWGSRFTIEFLNVVERDAYWVDGIKPVAAMIWYALGYDFWFAARALVQLIKVGPGMLLDGRRSASDPSTGLLRQLEDPARATEVGARYEEAQTFRQRFDAWVAEILGDEILGVSRGMTGPRGVAVERGDGVRRMVGTALYEAAERRAEDSGAKVVVFGHTHESRAASMTGGASYINTGTWTWRGDFRGEGKETWRDLFRHPERFTHDRVLHYARIDYDSLGKASGQLLVYEPRLEPATQPWWRKCAAQLRAWWKQMIAWLKDSVRRAWPGLG